MMQASMTQAGQHSQPTGPPSSVPTSQMGNMSLGAPGYPQQFPPGGAQPSYNYGNAGGYRKPGPPGQLGPPGGPPLSSGMGNSMMPPPSGQMGGQPMGNFPQRSSNYSNQSFGSQATQPPNSNTGPPPSGPPPSGPPLSGPPPSGPPMGTQQQSFPPPTSNLGPRPPMGLQSGSHPNIQNGPPSSGGPPGGMGLGQPPQNPNLSQPPFYGGAPQPNASVPGSVPNSSHSMSAPSGTAGNYGPPGGAYSGNAPPGNFSRPPTMEGPPLMGSQPPGMGPPSSGPLGPMGPPSNFGGPPTSGGPPAGGMMAGPAMGGPPTSGLSGPPGQGPPRGPPSGPMGGPPMNPQMGPPMSGTQSAPGNFGPPPGGNMTIAPSYPGGPGMGQRPMGPPGGPPTSMSYGSPPGPGGVGPMRPGGPGMPPGSPGLPPHPVQQQPKTKIDPDNMPNPVEVMKSDQEQRGSVPYSTSSRDMAPPLVTTEFSVIDDGNASPRYMRATMYTVPCSKDILNNCKIPMGLIVQPYNVVPQKENTLELVDCGPGGPIRCNRCKAYMSPYARFVDGGRKYMCPVCQCSNEVPQEYFCHLDHTGRRTDVLQRPELRYGSVEFVANKDYCKEGKLPRSPAYIFMIDVSYGNIQSGLLHLLSNTILSLLEHLPGSSQEGGSPIKVGFVTYDKVLQFYNVKGTMVQPQMMVMTDVDDVFVPMTDGFLVNLDEARTVLDSLMAQLPDIFSSNKTPQVVLEPVVRAGMEALKAAGRNGRLFVFHSSLPSAQATGLLKNRLDTKLLGTDKEKTLLNPVSSPYQQLSEECVKFGVAVELFLFPTSFVDVATLGSFVSTTGGELHFYKNFTTNSDGDRLLEDLQHSLTRPTAFDCVMRVRASTGLRPTSFYGSFYMSNTTDIELGNIDSDKAIAVEIKHDDKLREDENVFFQAALLYTDIFGQRKLRIHNMALGCSAKFPDVYRSCEIDTIVNFFSKSIVTASLSMPYKNIRENFSHQVAVILSCYRKHCSSQSPAGQLILPESLKLLPMYANCLLKSDALLSPPIVTLDEKCWFMRCLLSMPTKNAGIFIYPRIYSLHDLDLSAKGLPPLMRCTGQKLQDTGLYVIVNGLVMVLWVGLQFPVESVQKLFGVPSLAQLNTDTMRALPALDNPLSFRVRGVLEVLQSKHRNSMKLIVSRQKDKSEVFFRRQLKEDKGAGQWEGTTYIDFLCQIHREIKEILS